MIAKRTVQGSLGSSPPLTIDVKKYELALKRATEPVLLEIKRGFQAVFQSVAEESVLGDLSTQPAMRLIELPNRLALDAIANAPAFYVVFSSYPVSGKTESRLRLSDGRSAVYRGEGSLVYRRLESHLFNATYQAGYDERKRAAKKFSEPYYGACMKIVVEESGVSIDRPPYSEGSWAVLLLKLPDSGSPLRKQAELAFDDCFGKPAACREKVPRNVRTKPSKDIASE